MFVQLIVVFKSGMAVRVPNQNITMLDCCDQVREQKIKNSTTGENVRSKIFNMKQQKMNTDTVINYIKNNNHNRMNLQSLFECFSGDLITLGSVFRCREVLDGTRLTFGTVDGNVVKICVKVRLQVYPGYATETGWEAVFLPWRYERNRKI